MIRLQSVMLIAMILFSSGCAATKQARTVERLGFLKDLYPKMSEGNEKAGESQLMADTFYALIYQEVSKDYDMVDKPGPNTLRAQIAITHRRVLAHVGRGIGHPGPDERARGWIAAQDCSHGQTGLYRGGGDRGQGDRCRNWRSVESGCRSAGGDEKTRCRFV